MSERQRGVSLLEVMTYSGLLMLFLSGLYLVLVAGQKHAFQSRNLHEAQSESRVAMRKLTSELRNTSLGSIRTDDDPTPYCVFASTAAQGSANGWSTDAGGRTLWKKWVCFSQDSVRAELRRTELSFPSPSPISPTTNSFNYPSFSSMSGRNAFKVVARGIVHLEIQKESSDPGNGIRVVLVTELNRDTQHPTRLHFKSLVYPRNA